MTDSPAFRHAIDPKEQPILDSVLLIRDKLSLLKQDRSTYVRSEDVLILYNEVIAQVEKLNAIRAQKRSEQNRGSYILLCPPYIRQSNLRWCLNSRYSAR